MRGRIQCASASPRIFAIRSNFGLLPQRVQKLNVQGHFPEPPHAKIGTARSEVPTEQQTPGASNHERH